MGDVPEKKSILIIDDEKEALSALESILKRAGYMIECASSGSEAIAKAQKKSFDLIFLDVYLPEMNGVEIFKSLQKIDPNLKVCLMTGWPKGVAVHKDDYLALIEEGAIDKTLRKPFSRDEVIKVAREILGS